MEQHIQRYIILLLVMLVCTTQATIVQNLYQKLETGQNITGHVGAEFIVRSHLECAVR